MKINKRLVLVLFLTITLLVVSAFPAMAEAEKIQVTGTCTGLKFFVGDEADSKYRYWTKPDGLMEHWRNQLILFYCEYSDDRLNGYMMASDNWNTYANPNTGFVARTFGDVFSSDENGNQVNLWDGSYSAFYDSGWNYTMSVIYIGKGVNQTLMAKLLMTFPAGGFPFVDVVGELIVPGN